MNATNLSKTASIDKTRFNESNSGSLLLSSVVKDSDSTLSTSNLDAKPLYREIKSIFQENRDKLNMRKLLKCLKSSETAINHRQRQFNQFNNHLNNQTTDSVPRKEMFRQLRQTYFILNEIISILKPPEELPETCPNIYVKIYTVVKLMFSGQKPHFRVIPSIQALFSFLVISVAFSQNLRVFNHKNLHGTFILGKM